MTIVTQIVWLFILAIPIACISWTVTHEEIFREPHEWCVRRSKNDRFLVSRKFFYLFTCEYCFSHYVTIAFLILCDYKLLLNDWRGYILAGFSLVFTANVYMSLFALLRQAIKKEKVEIEKIESETDSEKE
ncbi:MULTISPECIES: hypothetical protein [unclassified Flavobacterium]|jgi:hypothetical protein|uniref:hypothetical protein n=1 Tax=unclassified Flavobacterium TaxID=196869 RepID=UPI001065EF91|nr:MULTISPECIES: hypothetical protein [unclassified Flavobacterium]MDQ1166209.1 hypothetical protein [Flavobacterium sp. SORGH_AS_0622]TDX09818.1 hypothetical protein EDB96_3406 [Flavobacterium sp. S87F.05.LMB.W.Kidney.N]BDU26755.1 hypothetical protein FLGSB24_34990 [Flavobacterium sp. GSB-24]